MRILLVRVQPYMLASLRLIAVNSSSAAAAAHQPPGYGCRHGYSRRDSAAAAAVLYTAAAIAAAARHSRRAVSAAGAMAADGERIIEISFMLNSTDLQQSSSHGARFVSITPPCSGLAIYTVRGEMCSNSDRCRSRQCACHVELCRLMQRYKHVLVDSELTTDRNTLHMSLKSRM